MKKFESVALSATNASQFVSEFLMAFLSGDHEKAASMLTSDFWFRAPLIHHGGDKAAYFAGAKEKVKYIRRFGILRQWADENEVATFYELEIETPQGSATMIMSDWHTIRNGKVASIQMVFDTAAKAARLLGAALTSHH
jgi:predicted SnoaL-like aldol condensation-catalyzing enzyme